MGGPPHGAAYALGRDRPASLAPLGRAGSWPRSTDSRTRCWRTRTRDAVTSARAPGRNRATQSTRTAVVADARAGRPDAAPTCCGPSSTRRASSCTRTSAAPRSRRTRWRRPPRSEAATRTSSSAWPRDPRLAPRARGRAPRPRVRRRGGDGREQQRGRRAARPGRAGARVARSSCRAASGRDRRRVPRARGHGRVGRSARRRRDDEPDPARRLRARRRRGRRRSC